MKAIILLIITFSVTSFAISQTSSFKYQTIVRDASGEVMANQQVSFQISILQGSSTGTNVYSESHIVTTNQFGLVSLEIGNSTVASGEFETIDWGVDDYFLQIELDETGGTNYQLMGISQLLSVPYSIHSDRSKKTDHIEVLSTTGFGIIETPEKGMIILNSDDKNLYIFDGYSWRVFSNSECYPMPTQANAGSDQLLYDVTQTSLNANVPEIGIGVWNISSGIGGTIDEPENPSSLFTGILNSQYGLDWSIYNNCDTTIDHVVIEFLEEPNLDTAFFVSDNIGDDSNPGTILAPFKSIGHALSQIPLSDFKSILIQVGNYYEDLYLIDSVNLFGGYNEFWEIGSSTFSTTLFVPSTGLKGYDVNGALIERITIYSEDAESGFTSSYAIYLNNCQGIILNNCQIYSGDGLDGLNGYTGNDGINGLDGQNGQPGCENGTGLCSTCSQPIGGIGGSSPFGIEGGIGGNSGLGENDGYPGQTGNGPGGGAGGSGGDLFNYSCCTGFIVPGYIANGTNGTHGYNGIDGNWGNSFGEISPIGYIPSNGEDGTDGENGSGGGGGGGGRGGENGCDSYGSSGGGGGSGGQAGTKAGMGTGGGGSFGVWVFNSEVNIIDCFINTGNGGDGGYGGVAGTGGIGGLGGEGGAYGGAGEQDDAGCGGWGGNGGTGGNGGHGGGGGGGPSIGIVKDPTSIVNVNTVTFNIGPGGQGGFSYGNIGQDGNSLETNF